MILALIILGLWVAVIGYKQQRKEKARGIGGGGARRGRRDYDEFEDEYDDEYDDDYGPGYEQYDRGYDDEPRRRGDDGRWADDTRGTRRFDTDGPRSAWPERERRPERPERPAAPERPAWPERERDRDRPKRDIPTQSRGGKGAEVEINPGKCARFAFCEHEAPEIFKLVGDRIDYRTSVPPDQVDAVAMAVKVCPARAIKMKTPGSKPYLPQPYVNDDERRPVRR